MRWCTANTSKISLLCSEAPSTTLRHWKQQSWFLHQCRLQKKGISVAMEASFWPPCVDPDLNFPSFPGQLWTTLLSTSHSSLPCRRGCRRQFCHPWHSRNIPVPGALPSSELSFPPLLIRNGFIPVIPQKTLSLTTWVCTGGSRCQGLLAGLMGLCLSLLQWRGGPVPILERAWGRYESILEGALLDWEVFQRRRQGGERLQKLR